MTWYRLLLCLYPASFRREYGDEMRAIFNERWAAASWPFGKLLIAAAALFEVVGNAVAVHGDLLRQDTRHAARSFWRAPAFAITAILVVALGTGANSAVFSVLEFSFYRALPFPEPDRLVKLWENRLQYNQMELSPANYRDWKERLTSFEGMAAFYSMAANLVDEGEPTRLEGTAAGADLFSVLGVGPVLGRAFSEADEVPGAPSVLLLSHRFWRTRFGGDPSILGKVVRLDDASSTVIGVMPRDFLFPNREVDFWMPAQFEEDVYADRNDNYLKVVARLGDGVTVEQATVDLARVTAQLEAQYPEENRDAGATIYSLRREYSRRARLLLVALAGAAVCVLFIACVNLANLLLARALARQGELVVRSAMGAGRERLARQLLTESVLICLLGGILGVGFAAALLPLLSSLVPGQLPLSGAPTIDFRALLFAGGLTLMSGLGVGLVPVVRAGREGFSALREGGRGGGGRRERLQSALVVAGVVSSVVLLVCSGLLMRALLRLQSQPTGFRTSGVLTMRTALPMPKYADTKQRTRWYAEVIENVEALPGVSRAAYISFLPMVMTGGIWPVVTAEESTRREGGRVASLRFVTPGFFDTLEIPLLTGRDVSERDNADQPFVAVVSDSFAQHYFPGEQPIGRRFGFAFAEREIVGVVGDIRVRGLEQPSEPQVYLPAGQVGDGSMTFYAPKDLLVRTTVEPESLVPAIREVIRAADAHQPISDVRTMAGIVAAQTASRTVQLNVVAAFAGVALLLAAVGIYGLLSFLVSQRQREIGLRQALGASRWQVLSLVLARGAFLAAVGIGIGGAIAYAAGRGLQSILAGVPASDPVSFLAAAGLCAAMTIAGSIAPALRAVRVDPVTALRAD